VVVAIGVVVVVVSAEFSVRQSDNLSHLSSASLVALQQFQENTKDVDEECNEKYEDERFNGTAAII
jgi:hypothetical protein